MRLALLFALMPCVAPLMPAGEIHEANLGQYLDRLIRDDNQALEVPAIQEAVAAIGTRVVAASQNPRKFSYSFLVLNDPVPKAFSAPGGYVYISTGLLGLCGSPDEVAAILAHEVAHVNERHPTKFLRTPRSAVAMFLFVRVGVPIAAAIAAEQYRQSAASSGDYDRWAVDSAGMQLGNAVTLVGTGLGLLAMRAIYSSYTADDEFAADAHAVDYCRKAGFDGKRLVDVLVKVTGFTAPGVTGLPSWHRDLASDQYPKLQDRIKRIKDRARR